MKWTPRSVGGWRRGAASIAVLAGLAASFGVLVSPGGASPSRELPTVPTPLRIGMNSCAARGCHGAVGSTDPGRGEVYIKDGAFTTWLNYDPHARAFGTLLNQRSVRIAEKLNADMLNNRLDGKPAHEASLCLSCHATVGPSAAINPQASRLSDGITCEACHGPARTWVDKHLGPAWPELKKSEPGWADLSSPTARAKICVGCHVGDRSRGMEVNHDLIAAGHPRLNFELAAYQAGYPKHWKEKTAAAEFEAKSWAIGQVVAAEAVLELLVSRALASDEEASPKAPAPRAVWPEFSEYECFACHHDLNTSGPRQTGDHVPGRLPWQVWPSAMLPDLVKNRAGVALDALDAIRDEMSRRVPRTAEVLKSASRSRGQLESLRKVLEREAFDPQKAETFAIDLASRRIDLRASWDRAAQNKLAFEALARALKAAGLAIPRATGNVPRDGSQTLDFPEDYDSPRNKP